jgi:hypothetical protein
MKLRVALGALLIAIAMTLGWSSTHTRDGEACRSACEEVASQCITACGEHENPVECESDCRDDEEDCMARCR